MEHLLICPEVLMRCQHCDAEMRRKKLPEHHERDCEKIIRNCKFAKQGCGFKDVRSKLEIHLQDNHQEHLLYMQEAQEKWDAEKAILTAKIEKMSLELAELRSMNSTFKDMLNQFQSQLSAVAQKQDINEERYVLSQQNIQKRMNEQFGYLTTVERRLEEHDGPPLHRISEYSRIYENARSGGQPCIECRPFYTHRDGYRMALILYPNGTGPGEKTHLSVFLALKRGNYDAILPWPFRGQVTITLRNADRTLNHMESLTVHSSERHLLRPRGEANPGMIGMPRFLPCECLLDPRQGFLIEDTIFIDVSIVVASN